MFDEMRRMLRKYEQGVQISVDIPLDDEGHFDRLCPSPECAAEFRINVDDWKEKVQDEVVYCPLCRHEAPSGEWNTEEQREYYRQVALRHLRKAVGQALASAARRFNARQPRGGFINISMSHRPGPTPVVMPLEAAEALRQHFTCEACGCRYSSLGAAFFCPGCGHNSAATTFAAAVQTLRVSVSNLEHIQGALRVAVSEDAAADTGRQLLENGLVKLVASFQRYAEAVFHKHPTASTHRVRKNLFQNLAESSALWRAATDKGYEDFLDCDEHDELNMFFQQRHLLAHKEGLVDEEYLTKSGDTAYRVGQKLQIKEPSVLRLADLVERLAASLNGIT